MIGFRSYKEADFNAVLDLLNKSKNYDTLNKQLLNEKLYDDPEWNPETTYLAFNNAVLVGFLQGVTRIIRGEKFGYIKLMAVDEEFRRKGIATSLYKYFEKYLANKGFNKVRIYDVPLNYFMPGVDPQYTPAVCFALNQGFKHIGDACNMIVDLNAKNWDTHEAENKLKIENIEASRAGIEDKQELFEFISNEWALWQNELQMAFKNNPVSIHIARLNGKIRAFSAYDGNNVGTGWFGPMGTHPDLRGKGLGSILLYRCLNDIKASGLTQAIIPWVAPVGFYSHYTGARINRVFWRFEKQLNNE